MTGNLLERTSCAAIAAARGVGLWMACVATVLECAGAPPANASDPVDARIRLLVYDADEVYRLRGYVGYQIDLEFESGETFVGLGSGDLDSLTFAAQDNHLF